MSSTHWDQQVNNSNFKCLYCRRNDHSPSQCRIVTNVNSRKDILRKSAKCFVCLNSGHLAKDCSVNYICRKCNGRHHVSICNRKSEGNAHENGLALKAILV